MFARLDLLDLLSKCIDFILKVFDAFFGNFLVARTGRMKSAEDQIQANNPYRDENNVKLIAEQEHHISERRNRNGGSFLVDLVREKSREISFSFPLRSLSVCLFLSFRFDFLFLLEHLRKENNNHLHPHRN